MPRATGPIGYIEHRSPMKDETGKYLIHPQFVYRDVYDFKNMRDGMRQHHQMATSQFLAAIQSIKDETMMALSSGMEVKIGDMFIIKPKLKLRDHKDADGNIYHKVYHEGELIPASEVVIDGFEVKTTREFDKEFYVNYDGNCSRIPWKVSFPPKESAQELLDITNFCKKHGHITVKDLMRLHGVTKYHAQKVLSGYCEGEFPKMTREREGRVFIYRRIGV